MVDESSHHNHQDASKAIFVRLEEKVTNISCNMVLLMVALANKFGPFKEVGGSKLEVELDENLGDSEDP
jgi:hypothetical protein